MNRSCSDMQEEIAGYVLGALDEDRRQAVQEHLKICPDCKAYLQALHEQEQALVALGEQVSVGMAAREERVIAAIGRSWRGQCILAVAKWAVAATVVLASGIAIGRLTSPQPLSEEHLKAEIQQAVLAEVDRRVDSALVAAADETAENMRVMAAQFASGSRAMMEVRLAGLVQLIETARRTDRQRVADALVQMELSRLDDRNQIAASLRSLATPAAELSMPAPKTPTTTNN
jgi:hypothetical protein